jgi:hypothetical protein
MRTEASVMDPRNIITRWIVFAFMNKILCTLSIICMLSPRPSISCLDPSRYLRLG